MKKASAQKKIIKELETTPIVQIACKKVGISRQTYYRWIKEDPKFFSKVKEAMELGVSLVSDAAESNVLNGIKNGDAGFTKFWLSNRHHVYRKPFMRRDVGIDFFEREMIKEYFKLKKDIDQMRSGKTPEEIEASKKKARAFFKKWEPYYPKQKSEKK